MASTPVVASAPVVASVPVAASAPSAASTPTVSIAIYGDDAMYGVSSTAAFAPLVSPNEPTDTQAALQSQFPDTGITIDNRAEGGGASSLVNMMNGVDGGGPPFAQRLPGIDAQIILTNHAINDDLVQSLAPYSDALIAWVQDVRAAGKIPVLEEPNPVCDTNHPYLYNYVSVMDNVAQTYNVPLVSQYAYIQTLPDWQSHFADCLFPDAYIDAVKSQREAAVLAPLVKTIIGE